MKMLEAIEQAIEESREAAENYSILYISLEPNDYILVQSELEAMSGKQKSAVKSLCSYPVYIELGESHLVMVSDQIIRHKTFTSKKMNIHEKQQIAEALLDLSASIDASADLISEAMINGNTDKVIKEQGIIEFLHGSAKVLRKFDVFFKKNNSKRK